MGEPRPPAWMRQTLDWRQPPEDLRRAMESLTGMHGWQALLAYVAAEVQRQHAVASNPQVPDRAVFDAVGRQNALVGLVDLVYRITGQTSPFAGSRVAWLGQWTQAVHPPEGEPPPSALPAPAGQAASRLPRRQSGSVL